VARGRIEEIAERLLRPREIPGSWLVTIASFCLIGDIGPIGLIGLITRGRTGQSCRVSEGDLARRHPRPYPWSPRSLELEFRRVAAGLSERVEHRRIRPSAGSHKTAQGCTCRGRLQLRLLR